MGIVHTGSRAPRVFTSINFKTTNRELYMANSHYSIELIDDDIPCAGGDDPIDINPELNKMDLAFFVDYYGNVQRISGNRSLNIPRNWDRLLTRIGRVGQVITSRGTERGNDKEMAHLQFRVRMK